MTFYDSEQIGTESGTLLFCALEECGYISLLNSIDIRRYPQRLIRACFCTLDEELRSVCDLLCFGKAVDLCKLAKAVAAAIMGLVPSGLSRVKGDVVSIAPLALYVVGGLLYFAEMPNPLATVYFGEDSIALASRLNLLKKNRGRALDVCAGPGIQGLLAASVGYDVTAVEVNPTAAAIARCNAALNGCVDDYTVLCQDFNDFARSKQGIKFNRIFANPPLIPIPDDYSYQFIGAGGVDGLSVTGDIVKLASSMLCCGGELVTIGASGGDETGPYLLDLVDKVLAPGGFSASLSLLRRFGVSAESAWVSRIVQTLAGYSLNEGPSAQDVSAAYLDSGVSAIYFFALIVRADSEKVASSEARSPQIFDLTSFNTSDETWWVC